MKLYELADQWRAISATLEESGGELTPELADEIAAIEGDLTAKAKNIVSLIRELDTAGKAIMGEVDRLTSLASSKMNSAKRLRDYLKENLETFGVSKLDLGIAKIAVQKASRPSIAWRDGEPPEGFRRVRVELDGTAAYEAFKAGTLPDGFTVAYSTFLAIR